MRLPAQYTVTFDAEKIRRRVRELGEEIGPWAQEVLDETGEQVLGICILRGGVHFFSDLMRAIPCSVEPFFCRASSYHSTVNEQTSTGVRVSFEDIRARGRSILLVDDICDTGATITKLTNIFTELGAAEVKTAVLVHRAVHAGAMPTWSGFSYSGPEWFVGYGMEDRNMYTNLPDVCTIQKDASQ